MPVTGDHAELAKLRRQLARLGTEGAKRITTQCAAEAQLLVGEGFQRGVSPSGQAWPAVTRGGQPLRDTGRLASSVVAKPTGRGFTVGTGVVYAPVHQFGATVTAKRARSLGTPAKGFFGKRVTIPARPFLPDENAPLPPPWQARIDEAAAEAIALFFGST
jgi:phage gpG-like protein